MEKAAQYEAPFEYVKKHVKPERDRIRSATYSSSLVAVC